MRWSLIVNLSSERIRHLRNSGDGTTLVISLGRLKLLITLVLLVDIMYIGLVDTIILGCEVVASVFIVKLGLLEETIILGLEGHDLGLLRSHTIHSVDELGKVLFLALTFLNWVVRRPAHLLQLKACLVPHSTILVCDMGLMLLLLL